MSELKDEDQTPFWTVMTIFDPEGKGGDFAYTVGLAERGLPELHMWARPSLGSDPGDDWKFSMSDTCGILNRLARRLLDDQLAVGDVWSEKYDANLVTVDYQVDPPESGEALEAFAAGDVPVLPIRWSLDRAAVGPSLPMTDESLAEAANEYAALHSVFGRFDGFPAGWRLPTTPDWSPDQRFGPRTPLVMARAGFVFGADGSAMIGIVSMLLAVKMHSSVSYPAALANATARPLGRVAAMEQIAHEAHRVGDEFAVTWGDEAAVDELLEWMDMDAPEEREEALDHVRHLLAEGLHSFLAAEAVRDACEASLIVAGHGPVMLGYIGNGLPPTKQWVAADSVTEVFRLLVAERSPQELVAAAMAWKRLESSGEGISEMTMKLDALTATTSAMAPHPNDWMSFELIRETQSLLKAEGSDLHSLLEWANACCVLLTHRGLFTGAEVSVFAKASADGVPGLEGLLNQPLLAAGWGGSCVRCA